MQGIVLQDQTNIEKTVFKYMKKDHCSRDWSLRLRFKLNKITEIYRVSTLNFVRQAFKNLSFIK